VDFFPKPHLCCFFTMRVREVEDEQERAALWRAAVAAYPPYNDYQAKTERRIPVFLAEPA
jgi:hypothetical protein